MTERLHADSTLSTSDMNTSNTHISLKKSIDTPPQKKRVLLHMQYTYIYTHMCIYNGFDLVARWSGLSVKMRLRKILSILTTILKGLSC